MMLHNGTESSEANVLVRSGGRSPGGTDLFIFTFSRFTSTSFGENFGIVSGSNGGKFMSSFFKGSYS